MQAFQAGKAQCSTARPQQAPGAARRASPCCAHRRPGGLARRDLLLSPAGAALLSAAPALAGNTSAGNMLPSSDIEGFAVFKPDRSKTPALRAGTVDREHPYSFLVPRNWLEKKVPNIQSGNYCQPRCAEPWTEVIFGDDSEGKVLPTALRLQAAAD
jgi:hypothetical protein